MARPLPACVFTQNVQSAELMTCNHRQAKRSGPSGPTQQAPFVFTEALQSAELVTLDPRRATRSGPSGPTERAGFICYRGPTISGARNPQSPTSDAERAFRAGVASGLAMGDLLQLAELPTLNHRQAMRSGPLGPTERAAFVCAETLQSAEPVTFNHQPARRSGASVPQRSERGSSAPRPSNRRSP